MSTDNAVDYPQRWSRHAPDFLSLGPDGPKVRYLKVGRGPALVLMHTVRTQLDLFQRVIPTLANRFTVYAFDYPGFDWSEIIVGADYSEATMRRHVLQFLDRLGLQDVTFAGESMGGSSALTAAAMLGGRIKQVVAFNPYDYLPGLERANLLASIIIKSVRAPLIGPGFAALENRMILAGSCAGVSMTRNVCHRTSLTSSTRSASAGAIHASLVPSIAACQATSRRVHSTAGSPHPSRWSMEITTGPSRAIAKPICH